MDSDMTNKFAGGIGYQYALLRMGKDHTPPGKGRQHFGRPYGREERLGMLPSGVARTNFNVHICTAR
jgi:hypothetical protein